MQQEIYALSRVTADASSIDNIVQSYNRPLSDDLRAAGCLAYNCYRNLRNDTVILAVGKWISLDAFKEHLEANRQNLADANRDLVTPPELVVLGELTER